MGSPCASAEPAGEAHQNDMYATEVAAATNDIDIARIRDLVQRVESAAGQAREQAIGMLEQETGLGRYGLNSAPLPDSDDNPQEVMRDGWCRYLEQIELAVSEKLKLIRKRPSLRNRSKRGLAVLSLGQSSPHVAFLPLLKAIVVNSNEPDWVRRKAIRAISAIPHDGLIPYLIDQLDSDLPVRFSAYEQLDKLTSADVKYRHQEYRRMQHDFEVWWRAHNADYEYVRWRTMVD